MSFRLVPKSVTLNDLERRNGVILRCFSEFGYLPGGLRESSRSLSHLLMSSCNYSCCTSCGLSETAEPLVVCSVHCADHEQMTLLNRQNVLRIMKLMILHQATMK